jgi:hypothetical protein
MMVRKQIYIGKRHEARLKRIAARRGQSEAEVIREALDRQLAGWAEPIPGDAEAGWALLSAAWRSRRRAKPGRAYRFRREDAYADRLVRFGADVKDARSG